MCTTDENINNTWKEKKKSKKIIVLIDYYQKDKFHSDTTGIRKRASEYHIYLKLSWLFKNNVHFYKNYVDFLTIIVRPRDLKFGT